MCQRLPSGIILAERAWPKASGHCPQAFGGSCSPRPGHSHGKQQKVVPHLAAFPRFCSYLGS